MRGRRAAAAGALLLLASLTGCAQLSDQLTGQGAAADPAAADEAAGATDVLATVAWGEVDGMVSVLVRNDGDRGLRRATAFLTAVDEHGVTIASSAAQAAHSDCCTVLDLPSGSTYGLYFDTTVEATDIADVEVRYRDVSWADDLPEPTVTATSAGLTTAADGSVVLADVTWTGTSVDAATVQAVLDGPDGEFLAVVSGRWHCFAPDQTQQIRMELYHPVPAGTTVADVHVLPIQPPNTATDYVDEVAACETGS